jgi:ectoine hydroxylase-related dioxygenase (phytanoyl-CoA dioxygenase family)
VLTSSEIEQFSSEGFLVLRGRFPTRALELQAEIQNILNQQDSELHQGRRFGRTGLASSHRFGGLMHRNELFKSQAEDGELLSDLEALLGRVEPFRDVLLSKPARTGGSLAAHQDLAYWDIGHENVLTAWLALSTARKESGALWLIPGSHRQRLPHRTVINGRAVPRAITNTLRHLVSLTGTGDSPQGKSQTFWAKTKEITLEEMTRLWPVLAGLGDLEVDRAAMPVTAPVLITADPGDVVLFHGLTIHGSGANSHDIRRDAYLVTYAARA